MSRPRLAISPAVSEADDSVNRPKPDSWQRMPTDFKRLPGLKAVALPFGAAAIRRRQPNASGRRRSAVEKLRNRRHKLGWRERLGQKNAVGDAL
jgi:hypothetical protein